MINDAEKKFHFRGQMENEVVKDYYRRHWIVIIPQLFAFLLFLALVVLFIVNIARFALPPITALFFDVMIILAVIGTGIIIHKFFMFMLEYFMNVVIITNNRLVIVKKTLFTQDDKDSVYMQEIQDIQKQQIGIFKNLLDYGEICINVGVPELTILKTVPNPDYHFRLLNVIINQRYKEEEKEIGKAIAKGEPEKAHELGHKGAHHSVEPLSEQQNSGEGK